MFYEIKAENMNKIVIVVLKSVKTSFLTSVKDSCWNLLQSDSSDLHSFEDWVNNRTQML